MTKFCPTCRESFQNDIAKCPDDSTRLVGKLPPLKTDPDFVDVYAASNEIEVERIQSFLADAGLTVHVQRSQVSQLPTAGDSHFVIAVALKNKEKASKKIQHARKDGIISSDGVFL